MTTRNRTAKATDKASDSGKRRRSGNSGPIAFFISLFIVAVGAIQLVSTFNTYAADLAHLNSLKREEAALIAKKQDLENDISRWNDKNYVAAQARERLGFVFPGEQSVHVQNPQAVTGQDAATQNGQESETDTSKQLPWYSELSYAFKKADEPLTKSQGNARSGQGGSQSTTTDEKDKQ
ncbi:FtsB family cell division protein [Bifidobacterium platyrrhinorum]|uniref:Septum formation initiator family protein n=1 Tax=Bifidobacterium platyrrhinorum TaxID=2661628 RepID=A0A6L9SUI6_9BIFI|nr:septum formation initiator family protein [Bifidobacterium platyrrhinorum]NEG55725.1 septum formation initiator family protein [Bifidobacterium platyrrhinorum]